MEVDHKKLTEGVLRILLPLRGVWEDAEWLTEAIEKNMVQEGHMIDLAGLLIRATKTVDTDERIRALSRASEMARRNREKEITERSREREDCENIICNLF